MNLVFQACILSTDQLRRIGFWAARQLRQQVLDVLYREAATIQVPPGCTYDLVSVVLDWLNCRKRRPRIRLCYNEHVYGLWEPQAIPNIGEVGVCPLLCVSKDLARRVHQILVNCDVEQIEPRRLDAPFGARDRERVNRIGDCVSFLKDCCEQIQADDQWLWLYLA